MHRDNCPKLKWDHVQKRFAFVVDCRPLCEVVNGRDSLRCHSLTSAFERMTNNLFRMLGDSWYPSYLASDPVLWHRQEYNRIADYIVNYTMEREEDWVHTFPPAVPNFNFQNCNLVCHSDGGTRAGNCSATGWFLEAIVLQDGFQHIFPIAMAGKFLREPASSLTVEVLALDDAISYVSRLIL